MIIPSVFLLNVRTSAWLIAERDRWTIRAASLVGQDKADALAYLEQVKAELAQRKADVAAGKSWFSRAIGNIAESLGGSGGAGASGVVGGIADTASTALDTAGSFFKRFQWFIFAGVIIVAGIFIYVKFGRK